MNPRRRLWVNTSLFPFGCPPASVRKRTSDWGAGKRTVVEPRARTGWQNRGHLARGTLPAATASPFLTRISPTTSAGGVLHFLAVASTTTSPEAMTAPDRLAIAAQLPITRKLITTRPASSRAAESKIRRGGRRGTVPRRRGRHHRQVRHRLHGKARAIGAGERDIWTKSPLQPSRIHVAK